MTRPSRAARAVTPSTSEPTLWELSLDMIATANFDGYLTRVNAVWATVLDYTADELTACPYIEFVHPDDVERTRAAADLLARSTTPVRFENRYRVKGGAYRWLSWSCIAPDGVTIHAVVRDVTPDHEAYVERERLYELAREREQLLDGVVENAPIGMAVTALYGKVLRANRALREITGRSNAQLLQLSSLEEITHPEDVQARGKVMLTLGGAQASTYRRVKRLVHAGGRVVWVESSTSLVCDAYGDPLHMVVQIQDVSVRKNLEERLQYFADVDTLTGMRNRRMFEADLTAQVGRCQRYGEKAALLILDLDDFKTINDTHGHKAGDDVLKAVAAALTARLRTADLAARLGGDEFGILLTNVSPVQARAVADDIQRLVFEAAVSVGNEVVSSRASVGVAFMDEQSADRDAVFAAADASMYAAKRAAKEARA